MTTRSPHTTATSKPVSVTPRQGSEVQTHGIRVTVQPAYASLDSDPANSYYKFVYRIRVTNTTDRTVQLLLRRWIIVDAEGERQEVSGEGVVGQQPVIAPGDSFEYASFCPLGTSWGTMEGSYVMRYVGTKGNPQLGDGCVADGPSNEFEVRIGRFFLVCPPEAQVDEV